jgi:glycosyltransferase 2 family protein
MNSRLLKRIWPFLKWGMFVAVLLFVARHGYKLWLDVDGHSLRFNWGWLALATVASVMAWLPSVWYWRTLISNFGFSPPWPQVIRSHYCGQLGKYTPGKAAVILIRTALIGGAGVPAPAAALAVTVESVTYMWAGTILAILLYPWLAPHLPAGIAILVAEPLWRAGLILLVLCVGLAGMVAVLRSYHRLNDLFRNTAIDTSPTTPSRSPVGTTVAGVVVFLAAWWIQGLTLGLTIQAVSTEPVNWGDWPFWTGSAAVAVVGGFIAIFSPGGLGVREGLLMELLSRQLGSREAVLVAVLLRGVMLAGEILVAGALYYGVAGVKTVEESKGPTISA